MNIQWVQQKMDWYKPDISMSVLTVALNVAAITQYKKSVVTTNSPMVARASWKIMCHEHFKLPSKLPTTHFRAALVDCGRSPGCRTTTGGSSSELSNRFIWRGRRKGCSSSFGFLAINSFSILRLLWLRQKIIIGLSSPSPIESLKWSISGRLFFSSSPCFQWSIQ